ncbi:hypothetical protein AX760_00870 [Pararhizobium antarcticum]|uniref:HutD-family protein n=1 Tax=Pararhizobium antarcticum TaxID=1798805 RepID=A0A657LZX8_9HYPH|nr:hypothetical protein AX761_09510 [Rhizobium sp. 58]OJG01598.1 hypothetical protein AX760_00870 [Pararhizobium antarcticum]
MHILRHRDYRTMPWKNGGGFTTEVAVFPEESDLAGFDWRISMAVVSMDGPFSTFPDIDRTLLLLEGKGMDLAIGDQPPVSLTTASQPFAFAADRATTARLAAGPITDLNVMTRRGRWTHHVERLTIDGRLDLQSGDHTMLLLALSPVLLDVGSGRTDPLERLDCALIGHRVTVDAKGHAEICIIRLRAV